MKEEMKKNVKRKNKLLLIKKENKSKLKRNKNYKNKLMKKIKEIITIIMDSKVIIMQILRITIPMEERLYNRRRFFRKNYSTIIKIRYRRLLMISLKIDLEII